METVKFVNVLQPIDIIDTHVRNKFRWEWLSLKDEGGDFFSDYVRKLDRDGLAWCCYCKTELKYGTCGVGCLKSHAKSKTHQRHRTLMKANQCYPVLMHAVKESEIDGTLNVRHVTTKSLPYGAPPNLDELGLPKETTFSPSDPKPISIKDRCSHQEATAFPSSQSDDSSDSNQNSIGASPTTRLPEVAADTVEVKIERASEDSPEKNDWNSSAMASETTAPPEVATDAVLMQSDPMPADSETVKGYDFNNGIDHHALFESMSRSGFQATNVGNAIKEINRMIDCKLQNIPEDQKSEINLNPVGRDPSNCTIFLSYTSNLISSGTREAIRYVVEHNMVDCIVSSAGGIEEDFIKCLAPTYIGDFKLAGRELRKQGINRIGNLLVPNSNYCLFETWVLPILDEMLREQKEEGMLWTPSKVIHRLGKEIDNPESVYYWAYKNNIPVFCPALTDGSLGDMIYFHSYNSPGLVIDMVEDIRRMNLQAVRAVNSGMIILGGGLIKHHTCNANLMRNGADFSLFVNTGHEFDGSDSGAAPDEAISWGKIKVTAKPVKVCCDASIIFPILVAETFARRRKDYEEFYVKRE